MSKMKTILNLTYLKFQKSSSVFQIYYFVKSNYLSQSQIIEILFLFLFFSSCTSDKEISTSSYFKKAYIDLTDCVDLNNYNYSLIIPRAGCSGCISRATLFVLENYDRLDSTLIVFTKIGDVKLLKIQLGDMLEKNNVLIDSENLLASAKSYSIYPRLLTLKNGNISSVKDFNEEIHMRIILK